MPDIYIYNGILQNIERSEGSETGIKGQDRTTTTGAAEEIAIPSGSKRVYVSCDPSSKGNLNINADATTSSFYISSSRDLPHIDLLGVTKLSTWMVAGNASFLFFG